MFEIKLDNSQSDSIQNSSTNINSDSMSSDSTIGNNPTDDSSGLTLEELNDANKIAVTIADNDTPLAILFGPPACGKTMTLIRLTRYLRKKGYTVEPVRSFRPAYDGNYANMCEKFDQLIFNEDAAKSTSLISFMLVKISYQGRPLCQILEGPGEYYFNPKAPKAEFPKYVNKIISSQNRKIWAIMLEPDTTNPRMDTIHREQYANRVTKLKTKINPKDKVMFIYNKIDQTDYVISPGQIRYKYALQNTNHLYPNILNAFTNPNPITKIWQPYKFDFIAFQTGDYSLASDGTKTFEEGNDIYPQQLWNMILKRIRG